MKLFEIERKKPIINLTSLIDILFLLIIFFVVTMRFVQQSGMDIKLPKSKASKSVTKTKKLIIEIDKKQRLFINGKSTTWQSMAEELKSKELNRVEPVILNIDESVIHRDIIRLMDILKNHEFQKIIFGTTPTP